MNPENIDYNKLHSILYKFKFSLEQIKPYNYNALKPHIQKQIDVNVNALVERASIVYEAYLTDEVLIYIGQKIDPKTSYQIHKALIIDEYKNKLYDNLPKEHPLKYSDRIFLYLIISTILILLVFLVFNTFNESTLLYSFYTLIIGIIISIITKKIYLYKKFSTL
ncbi:hypothetical protein OBK16_02170 [Empedobacter falsenii]